MNDAIRRFRTEQRIARMAEREKLSMRTKINLEVVIDGVKKMRVFFIEHNAPLSDEEIELRALEYAPMLIDGLDGIDLIEVRRIATRYRSFDRKGRTIWVSVP